MISSYIHEVCRRHTVGMFSVHIAMLPARVIIVNYAPKLVRSIRHPL